MPRQPWTNRNRQAPVEWTPESRVSARTTARRTLERELETARERGNDVLIRTYESVLAKMGETQ